ncbi:hypothetical protein RHSIM_Rhsim10G0148300 [Rhododendron simsii]|uniref:VDE lipocalin domain-containing protein n=1 Tax=Rhododendron simsii TaxID=118357 RepID=A0A834GA25_RHOSS|nr:hypothetical protein RHSIM_Rhsim10G0148300 [Rhododendron simsii]
MGLILVDSSRTVSGFLSLPGFPTKRLRFARTGSDHVLRRSGSPSTASAVLEASKDASVTNLSAPPVRIVALVGEGSVSPLKSAPWLEVMLHTAKRLKWVDEGFEMSVFTDNLREPNSPAVEELKRELSRASILVIVALTNQESVKWVQSNSKNIPNIICFDSSPTLTNKLGGSFIQTETKGSIFTKVAELSLPKKTNESTELVRTISEAWERHNSDDIRFCLLIIINAYIRPVPILNNLRAKGFSTLNCMVRNCGPQILNCLLDPNCRNALQCLNQCSPVDQVCNYRCIASYESPNLEEFSLCVLQKHNCLELDAKIPTKPHVPPMVKFRGEDICHETAEDLFVGWLGSLDWSWRVVAGQNAAYDQFPCQYQLFYRGKAKGSFWYEPVFQVKTLGDGKLVWRRRKYRVKRAKIPGTFNFSVLDNGVVSNEFWTIVDVSDDLSWGLFHYHGAARVAGQSYTGAVLVSPNGEYPNERESTKSEFPKCSIIALFIIALLACVDAGKKLGSGKDKKGHLNKHPKRILKLNKESFRFEKGDKQGLISQSALNYVLVRPRSCKTDFICRANKSDEEPIQKFKRDSLYIDKHGKFRHFNHKKVSRKKGGSLRGQGWKYGSGFVDGIFPVLSPMAQQILKFVQKEEDVNRIHDSLGTLPPTNTTWDDIISGLVQLRLNKDWDQIIVVCEWILHKSSFHPDVICYNLLIDAYGQKSLYQKAESTYLNLLQGRCIPTEDTYALLVKAYCISGLLAKAEAVFDEMRKNGHPPTISVHYQEPSELKLFRTALKQCEKFF